MSSSQGKLFRTLAKQAAPVQLLGNNINASSATLAESAGAEAIYLLN